MNAKVNKIARKIVMASGKNVFDDFYDFYSDGKWIIQITRNIYKIIQAMSTKITAYNTNIVKLDEQINYMKGVKMSDMGTSSALKSYNKFIKNIKKYYENYDKEEDENKKKQIYEDYMNEINEMKAFNKSYEESCVNVFLKRYREDYENVKNLLNLIENSGKFVNK